MRSNRVRGFSLIELMFTIVLASIMLALSFSGLRKAQTSGSSRGMATAVAAELRLAREKAISKGSPVAVVFRQGVSRSLFFLEGETLPVVSRTVNYEGDYPNGAIAVATYQGPVFGAAPAIPGSKSTAWKQRLTTWLPTAYQNDKVFMFTPNGTVVTNDVPAAGDSYRVIVATGAEVSGDVLQAAGEPQTITISQSGAVESFGRLLGHTGTIPLMGANSPAVASPPVPPVDYVTKKPTILVSRVTPVAEEIDGNMVHVLDKGEYLTLEIFAESGDGRPLYAGWQDSPLDHLSDPEDFKGAFSVPGAELERMEFYPEYDIADNGSPPDVRENIWRSVWTWTPPAAAQSGDQYDLSVDVTDAKKVERAVLPDIDPVVISPPGEIVFESNRSGRWQLYTMWADGSRTTPITSGDHDYRCASATADGKLIAYQRDTNEVWVMNIDGTGQLRITNNGVCPTISPAGNTIAFMRGNKVMVRRLDTSNSPTRQMDSVVTAVNGSPTPANRIAYSADGKWVYYTKDDGTAIQGSKLSFAGAGLDIVDTKDGAPVPNIASVAQVGGLFTGRKGEVYYHADRDDPYLGRFDTASTQGSPAGAAFTVRESQTEFEAFPAISPSQDLLLYCEQVGGTYQIFRCLTAGNVWMTSTTGVQITTQGQNLRPAWIHQGGGFH